MSDELQEDDELPSRSERDEESGPGGWLVLLGVGVSLAPMGLLRAIVQDCVDVFRAGSDEFAEPISPSSLPLLKAVICYHFVVNGLLFIAYAVLALQFFNCSRRFPRFFVLLAVVGLIDLFLNATLVSVATQSAFSIELRALVPVVLSLGIWTPYLLRSERVRRTFVRCGPMEPAEWPPLTIVSGCPGTGKTTLSRSLARLAPRGVHVVSDEFFAFIVDMIVPSLPAADSQNATVTEAIARAVLAFVQGSYNVVLDGVVRPQILNVFRRDFITAGIPVDYIVLRAPLADTIRRGTTRPSPVPEEVIRALHPQFADLGVLEHHVVDTTSVSAHDLCADVVSKLGAGHFRLSY